MKSAARNLPSMITICGIVTVPMLAWFSTHNDPPWLTMWSVAAAEFSALKLMSLAGLWRSAPPGRGLGYLALWPGMDARAFLASEPAPRPAGRELAFALVKFALGLGLCAWTAANATTAPVLVVGWAGMVGIVFALHFGFFHVGSWVWRSAGVTARPIMDAPVLARSVAEFWGARWNLAFADNARRFVLRPLARRIGAAWAGAVVFLVSGFVHETVISLPARGGWGGPTLYFLLQAAGAAVEKSAVGRRLGLGAGARGRAWTLFVAAAPAPLLLHSPFVEKVIVPFFQFLAELLT
jgi:hypothetical protein